MFIGLLCIHGVLNPIATNYLLRFVPSFVFLKLGKTVMMKIVLLTTISWSEMHKASVASVLQTRRAVSGLAFNF